MVMGWREEFRRRLKSARENAGLSQIEAGESLRRATNTISRWELGKSTRISFDDVMALAALYAVTVGWLIGEEGALDLEEVKVLEAMRDLPQPDRRKAIVAVSDALRPEPIHQSPPLLRVAEDQGSYQADPG